MSTIDQISSDAISEAVHAYLQQLEYKDRLRFITCGSVDDGKSTLIGRLLYDTQRLTEDQLTTLSRDSVQHGTQGSNLDFALLVDGLSAEREQGITIDVAYRFFSTDKRSFIVADCPGHEQYTRNMATGASTAELAIVLLDARKGLLKQTRRHSYIVSLFGIRHVLLAVNKMDLVNYSQDRFIELERDYRKLAEEFGIPQVTCIPISALAGDNVASSSQAMPWYQGPSLLQHLETVSISAHASTPSARLPVQWVSRPDSNFRGYAGNLSSGMLRVGDVITVQPSGKTSQIAQLFDGDQRVDHVIAGQPVTLTLADEIDISRGDVICSSELLASASDQLAAHILWMTEAPLLPGRHYWLRLGTQEISVQVTEIAHRVDINTQSHDAARELHLNEIGFCKLILSAPIAFERYVDDRALGGFVLIDRTTNATVGCGTVDYSLRRADNVRWQDFDIDRRARATQKHQQPRCLWFTGLSGSGKSTIANLVEKRLHALGRHTYVLDGDNVRHGLSKDLGFTDADRVENIRRVAEVARLMVDAGLIVMVSFISPFRSERQMARELFNSDEFIEVFVDTPLEVCEQRDIKGLYKKARSGLIPNFTGIGSPYERPEHPELHVETVTESTDVIIEKIVERCLQ